MRTRERDRVRWILVGSAAVTLLLWVVPYGWWIAYPLFLLSTLAHELGHGLAAAALGGDFVALRMWPDGSGVAHWSGPSGRTFLAAVAAGGLLGPAAGASLLFLAGTRRTAARWALLLLGAGFAIADVLVVRNLFGILFVGVLALGLLAIAIRASTDVARVAVLFLGVQLALSVFSRSDYLFTREASTAGGTAPSDVEVMARALWLPHWFWGIVCAALSLAILGWGLGRAWNGGR